MPDRRRPDGELGFRSRRGWRAARLLPAVALGLGLASAAAQTPAPPPIEQRVDAFLAQLEARRKELGVPGAAVVVVQGDRILRIAGLGQRSIEHAEPVTEDTVFGIGSVTKMFTSMAVVLAVSEGKMTFEDHPRRFVPSFRLKDPEADAKLNMIDLLAHRSGLDRSDLTFLLAPFTQAEMFELAARAKPAAKLREKFLYNNTMVSLAGAAAARAYDTTYERLMSERLFNPLGMPATTSTLEGLMASRNRAIGYSGAAGALTPQKPSDLAAIAPAGAINSTARDMGAWLRFLNARGQLEGALKVSPAAYARLFEPHQKVSADESAGLGFMLETRSGVLIASHGGNVPGYSAHLVHVPERSLSFALLTNLTNAGLPGAAHRLFWEHLVRPEIPGAAPPPPPPPPPSPPPSASPIPLDQLPGLYFATSSGTFDIKKTDGGLVAVFAGQPPYPLKAAGTNVYELAGLDGFALAFAESTAMPGRLTVLLRQPPPHPAGNIAFLKKDAAWLEKAKAQYSGPGAELIGSYHSGDRSVLVEIVPYRQGIALILTTVPPRPLVQASRDLYRLEGFAETYRLTVKRASNDGVVGFTYEQPGVRDDMLAEVSTAAADTAQAAREILERAVAAAGGAEALDRLVSRTSIGRASAPTHGIDGRAEERVMVGKRAARLELGAFGKFVLKVRSFTNERGAGSVSAGGERTTSTGKELEAERFSAVPHPLYRWKERFPKVAVAGEAPVNGENAHVIELTPASLAPSRLYISAKSFMILREEVPSYAGDALQPTSVGSDYWDYRVVSGVRLPFASSAVAPGLGRLELTFDSVLLDAPIDPKVFEAP